MDTLSVILVPINRAGWPFIAIFFVVSLFFLAIFPPLGWMLLLATAWCTYFFRDPVRFVPTRENLLVSPADGKVSLIMQAVPPKGLNMGDEPLTRVSIFLNVFNVHVNRIPIASTVTGLHYHPGKFLHAATDKASDDNERQEVKLTLSDGRDIAVVQIAGLVARRIICTLKQNQAVATGERFGLIRFGSRTDIYLPKGVEPMVAVGQTAVGGETIIADLNSTETQRNVAGI